MGILICQGCGDMEETWGCMDCITYGKCVKCKEEDDEKV